LIQCAVLDQLVRGMDGWREKAVMIEPRHDGAQKRVRLFQRPRTLQRAMKFDPLGCGQ